METENSTSLLRKFLEVIELTTYASRVYNLSASPTEKEGGSKLIEDRYSSPNSLQNLFRFRALRYILLSSPSSLNSMQTASTLSALFLS